MYYNRTSSAGICHLDQVSCQAARLLSALKRVLEPQGHLRYLTNETRFHIDDKLSTWEIDQGIDMHPQKDTCRDVAFQIRPRPQALVSYGDISVVIDTAAIKLKGAKTP